MALDDSRAVREQRLLIMEKPPARERALNALAADRKIVWLRHAEKDEPRTRNIVFGLRVNLGTLDIQNR